MGCSRARTLPGLAALAILGLLAGAGRTGMAAGGGRAQQEGETVVTDAAPRKVVIGTTMYAMWGEYPGLDSRLAALSRLVGEMAAEAARKYPGAGLDLAVLPENAVTGGLEGTAAEQSVALEGKVLDTMGAVARKHKTYLVVPMGLAEEAERGIYYNACILLDREGRPAGSYHKVHPVDSADTGKLEGGFLPGKDFPVLECDFGKVGIQICYDMVFDDGWEALARKGAEIVCWPSQSPQTIQPRSRARRHRYYVVSSTWRNNASVFDPTGEIIAQTTAPSSVLVEQVDLSYALVDWQPGLDNGEAFARRYGKAVGYRYSEAEDGGIFWSNDPSIPVMRMVRELDLELVSESVERNRRLQDALRGGPPSAE